MLMKRTILLTIFLSAFCLLSVAQNPLQAYMSYSTFRSPADGPFIEAYLAVNGQSVTWVKQENGKFMATVEVTYVFRQDSSIVNFSKLNLQSPQVGDTSALRFNIIDQQRIPLAEGEYVLEISIRDINQEHRGFTTFEELNVGFADKGLAFSGIELVESFTKSTSAGPLTKSGFDVVPYVFSFFPEHIANLKAYSEIYGSAELLGKDSGFLVRSYIQSFEKGGQVAGTVQNRRMQAQDVNVIFNEFDISKLPSGNYYLMIEVRDRENELLGVNKLFFQRSNPGITYDIANLNDLDVANTFAEGFTNVDSLRYFVRSLAPIASEVEKIYAENGLNAGDLGIMQKYFYSFWVSRNPTSPGKSWELYRERLKLADQLYGTPIKPGFETDRGRVFLQYGPPNTVTKQHNEPSAYPYEIWHYYTLQNQSNKKFVFYNPDLVTNDFELIHSDALGEIYNAQWQTLIFKRDTPYNDINDPGERDQWGNRSRQYFNNPY